MKARAIFVAAALVFGLAPAAQAIPVETFNFTGTCGTTGGLPNCTGTGIGTLVLAGNYILGSALSVGDFVSFNYSSNQPLSFSIVTPINPPPGDLVISQIVGSLPTSPGSLPGPANVIISAVGPGVVFMSNLSGQWCAGGCAADFGTVSQWSETPLPAALPLFATGIGGLGLLGWRRKRKAQAVA
jgi:hypothetical protein